MIGNLRKILAPFLIVTLLVLTSCAQEPPSRYDAAQKDSTQGAQRNQTIDREAIQGSNFNKFFPDSGEGYERVYTQEKQGFAQAALKLDGQKVATLSIADTTGNEKAKEKFATAEQKIDGYPAVEQGRTTTAILVADRYQVKVSSSQLSPSEREEWLSRFNLNGLANLR